MNRAILLAGTIISVLAAILVGWAPMVSVQAEPATVGMVEDVCSIFTLDGDVIADFHFVLTNNANGNEKVTCKAKGVVNTQGSTYKLNFDNTGRLCGLVSGAETTNWQSIHSDNGDGTGNVILQCRTP